MDTLDLLVLLVLGLAVAAYFTKGSLWAVPNEFAVASSSGDSRDIVAVLKDNGKNYVVFYGSQTGTAEDYAKKFAKELKAKFSLNVLVADIEDYDLDNLQELPCVASFFISTYGEGDFPDPAVALEDMLNNANEDDLEGLKYTLFGLGNTTYEFYQGAAKKADKGLTAAGAKRVGELGMGDDGAGTLDEDYLSWKEQILEVLKDSLNLHEHEQHFEPSYTVTLRESKEIDGVSLGEPTAAYISKSMVDGPYDHSHPYVAPIVATRELCHPESGRNCIHAEFDLSNTQIKYSTGDHVGVWPSNSDEKVSQFLQVFNLEKDQVFDIKPIDATVHQPFPSPATIGATVRNYLEITGPVSRDFFSTVLEFAPNDEIKQKIARLAKDKEAFAKEVTCKFFNVADAILYVSPQGGKWVPWNFLIEAMPKLQPRYYSISSSSLSEKQTVTVTAMVENQPNPVFDDKRITGVTTNLFRHIQLSKNKASDEPALHYDLEGPRNLFSGYKLPIHIRKSTFRLPSNPATPVLMVGPGTGVAPFRGFIRDRVKQVENGQKLGKNLLFYGCRDHKDFLYEEEWVEYSKKLGDSFEMITALSRTSEKKVYVQNKIMERKAEVLELINAGAFIYVCGDAGRMAKDVHSTLAQILAEGKNISIDQANDILKSFKTSNKYQEDVW